MTELSKYERFVVLSRLVKRTRNTWLSATELCVTPESLKRLVKASKADRYYDGKRWRYRAAQHA